LILTAYLLDWILGDPEWFPHPVRLMGRATQFGEQRLRHSGQSVAEELLAGAALTAGVVGASYWCARRATGGLEIVLGWTCLASRNLVDESGAVLGAADLETARQKLSRIVGRDTHDLPESEVYRALIETLAESACDGIVAPLFYMAIGGVPLAMAYKAVNTLDSMIGHADERYFYFGKVAARLDDVANYLPSRLTALLIALAAGRDAGSAWRIWRRDGYKHKSPNAGQPESAMAGALQVRLGGSNTYGGEMVEAPLLGAEFALPTRLHAKRALRLVTTVSLLAAVAASSGWYWWCSRRSR
jgi:adenosylcobinamide-phosphate synthase